MMHMSSIRDDRPFDWYRVRLNARDIQHQHAKRLLVAFDSAYLDAGGPARMHLYMASRRDGGADIYLAASTLPAVCALLYRFHAERCEFPWQPLTLIGGSLDTAD